MNQIRPLASASFDLDNQWTYMKTHGDVGWESFPSYLDILVPRVLQFLAERKLTITFFVVGQDAALPKNHCALQAIAASGHEIGNHSFSHEPWLHLYSHTRIEEEIGRTHELIELLTGCAPRGFRGPGYSFSPTTLEVLKQQGYYYDASALPTWIGPLARAYYFMTSEFSGAELEKRNALFGSLKDCFRPLKPHMLPGKAGEILEIPVTTMPLLRVPFHASYIIYLSTFSPTLGLSYFHSALRLCRLTGVQPSLLLHPLDFLGCDDVSNLAFFPGMNMRSTQKTEILTTIMDSFCDRFCVLTLGEYASHVTDLKNEVLVKSRKAGVVS